MLRPVDAFQQHRVDQWRQGLQRRDDFHARPRTSFVNPSTRSRLNGNAGLPAGNAASRADPAIPDAGRWSRLKNRAKTVTCTVSSPMIPMRICLGSSAAWTEAPPRTSPPRRCRTLCERLVQTSVAGMAMLMVTAIVPPAIFEMYRDIPKKEEALCI